jgi:hypothetical protein
MTSFALHIKAGNVCFLTGPEHQTSHSQAVLEIEFKRAAMVQQVEDAVCPE